MEPIALYGIIIGTVATAVGLVMMSKGINKTLSFGFTGIGVIALVVGLILGFGGFNLNGTSPTTVIGDSATWDNLITVPIAQSSYETYSSTTHTFNVAMSKNINGTFTAGTGVFKCNISMTRSDVLTTNAVAVCSLGTVGQVSVTGAVAQPIIAQNADLSSQCKFTKVDGTYAWGTINVLTLAGSSATVQVETTLNHLAVANMAQYGISQFTFTVAGQAYTVNCILTTA